MPVLEAAVKLHVTFDDPAFVAVRLTVAPVTKPDTAMVGVLIFVIMSVEDAPVSIPVSRATPEGPPIFITVVADEKPVTVTEPLPQTAEVLRYFPMMAGWI